MLLFCLDSNEICKFEVLNSLAMTTSTKHKKNDGKMSVTGSAVKSYTNDPYFIKKREVALDLIKKTGLPDSFTKENK